VNVPDVPSGARVLAVGIDVVAVDRFAASLAARFAVKEAAAKALGVPSGMDWHDCQVISENSGRPVLEVTKTVAAAAADLGITGWRISVSHDAGIAAAVVIALG
jgi:holo-[acyl-carrier protein] synthase